MTDFAISEATVNSASELFLVDTPLEIITAVRQCLKAGEAPLLEITKAIGSRILPDLHEYAQCAGGDVIQVSSADQLDTVRYPNIGLLFRSELVPEVVDSSLE